MPNEVVLIFFRGCKNVWYRLSKYQQLPAVKMISQWHTLDALLFQQNIPLSINKMDGWDASVEGAWFPKDKPTSRPSSGQPQRQIRSSGKKA